MNLTSPTEVKAWCIENSFHPNKVLGQNFLIDHNVVEAIAELGLKEEGKRILEIGPGLGVLTEALLKRNVAVTAIEKDPVLAARLKSALGSPDKLTVIEGDALEVHTGDEFDCMVSNLPYQAGTRILMELAKVHTLKSMTVLVQTEVAERLAAGPGSRTRGLSGVWVQLDYDVTIVRKVSASCFWPRPQIGSAVVKLIRHHRNLDLSLEIRKNFYHLTKLAFAHRRKQLGSIFKDLIQSTARAEELSNNDWIEIAKALKT